VCACKCVCVCMCVCVHVCVCVYVCVCVCVCMCVCVQVCVCVHVCEYMCLHAYLEAKLSDCQPVVVMVTYEGRLRTTNKNSKNITTFSVSLVGGAGWWVGLASGCG